MNTPQLFPLLITISNEEIKLVTPVTVIGRSSECNLQVNDVNVSRRHAQLERTESGDVILRDLGSRNGSWVNDQKVEAPVTLKDGDRVRFGDVSYTFRSVQSQAQVDGISTVVLPDEELKPPSTSTLAWQAVAPLTLVRGDNAEFGVVTALTLGRDPSNDISLPNDGALSQHHARFDLQEGRLLLTDLKSRNGSWVNGQRINMPVFLKHGDRVLLGSTVFRLREGNRPLQPLPAASKQRSGCLGLGIVVSGVTALIGLGAIVLAVVLVGAFVIYPLYFAPTPTVMPTWTPVPTWTAAPMPTGGGEVSGAAATQQAAAEKRALRALVLVIVPVGNPDKTEDFSTGSGSLVSESGHVLTNFHVVGDMDSGEYYNDDEWVGIGLNWDNPAGEPNTFYRAEIVRADPKYDLALVHIFAQGDGDDLPADLKFPFLPVGNSDQLEIGEPLAVIGYPGLGGMTPTFTRGSVSGFLLDEVLDIERGWIKTDAEINPGNSGGMAINSRGELIGVPTAAYYNTQVTGKISEIRPINVAQPFLDEIP